MQSLDTGHKPELFNFNQFFIDKNHEKRFFCLLNISSLASSHLKKFKYLIME